MLKPLIEHKRRQPEPDRVELFDPPVARRSAPPHRQGLVARRGPDSASRKPGSLAPLSHEPRASADGLEMRKPSKLGGIKPQRKVDSASLQVVRKNSNAIDPYDKDNIAAYPAPRPARKASSAEDALAAFELQRQHEQQLRLEEEQNQAAREKAERHAVARKRREQEQVIFHEIFS